MADCSDIFRAASSSVVDLCMLLCFCWVEEQAGAGSSSCPERGQERETAPLLLLVLASTSYY
jgi:hypothetical protein